MKQVSVLLAGVTAVTGLLCSAGAIAHEKGDWIVRAGAATVSPDDSSSTISTTVTGALPGTSVEVDSDTQLGLNIVYMMSDNLGIELLAASPFEHDVTAKGLGQYGFDTTALGSVKHLPPTLSVQYYFGVSQSVVRPYIGLGINYTTFFSESLTSQAKTELGADNLDLDDSVGLAAQLGIDWSLNDKWLINASVWRMDIETEATLDSDLGKVKVDVDIDPWVYMVGVGYKF
jgi:outer membrane protein